MLENTRKVLITGGAGFIGSHLAELLLQRNHHVLCLDDFNSFYDPAFKLNNIRNLLPIDRFKILREDICNRSALENVFNCYRPDIVVHLAARAGVGPSLQDPELYMQVNINGTYNVLEASVKACVKKFIFGSSSSVYGLNQKTPFQEDDSLLTPISPYAATKIAGEALCHCYASLYGISVVSLRFFTVYGPRQRPDLAIHKFARLISTKKPLPFYGDGSMCRDYTYISDIIDGIISAIDYDPPLRYDVFNLGSSHPVTLAEMVGLLEKFLDKSAHIEYLPAKPGDVPQTWADIHKAQSLLGFNPTMTFENGLASFYRWFQLAQDNQLLYPRK